MILIKSLRTLCISVAAVLSGCVSWQQPVPPVIVLPDEFSEAPAADTSATVQPGTAWWKIFGDSQLNELMELALADNPDLAAAEAKLATARAEFDAARAALWPATALTGDYSRTRTSKENAPPYEVTGTAVPADLKLEPKEYITQHALSHAISYELDVFGRLRHNRNAARAQTSASEADLRAARLALTTQAAASWYQLLALTRQKRIAEQSAALADRALALHTYRVDEGLAATNSTIQLEQTAADAYALVAQLNATQARQYHALAALCGLTAEQLTIDDPGTELPETPAVPTGVPSTVLERRPDIAAANAQMEAAAQRVGAATAAFFPQFSLTGVFGFQSEALKDLLSGDARAWSLGPSISVPIFDGGRNRAALQSAQGGFAAAAAAYRGQVLTALREVDDALSDGRELSFQIAAAEEALAAAQRNWNDAMNRFESGMTAREPVLAAQQSMMARERTLIALQGERLFASIALIQALGGGWSTLANHQANNHLSN